MFKIGDTVSCSGFGIGIIVDIENQDLGGRSMDFYVVGDLQNTDKIKISTTTKGKLRGLLNKSEMETIVTFLKTEGDSPIKGNNRTFYLNLLNEFKTGDLEKMARVLKSLTLKNEQRKLRVEEKKLYDRVKEQISTEMAFVYDMSPLDAKSYLEKTLMMDQQS
ncbi:MAG: hypothetical protein HOE90_22110 [Bacteriovoracaceae bacterium]|jgi:CarD family transcriptional regulator|nr:hypothetical protein [Bacteriovoracaceae bacterium]